MRKSKLVMRESAEAVHTHTHTHTHTHVILDNRKRRGDYYE